MQKSYEDILEASLPQYIRKDICALKEGYKSESPVLDCLFCELQGSVNSAVHSGEISEEQAVYIRSKYLNMEN